jgi:hypothetical protein
MLIAVLLLALPAAPQEPGAAGGTLDQQVAADAAAIVAALEEWADDRGNKARDYDGVDDRVLVWSDMGGASTKRAIKAAGKMLGRMDRALGVPVEDSAPPSPLRAVFLQREEAYLALCDALAEASAPQRAYFTAARGWTGFTLYAPRLTVYFHDPRIQDEARAEHNLGHNLAHLEVHRRYGVLPLWLAEGIATACEEGAFGEVWAPWNLKGFVYADSHAEWRGESTQAAVAATAATGFAPLWSYSADPFREDPARLAFAFATYGLDRDPVAFGGFLECLRAAYSKPDTYGKREDPAPELCDAWLSECFGEDFGDAFRSWWEKPPSWRSKPKPIER